MELQMRLHELQQKSNSSLHIIANKTIGVYGGRFQPWHSGHNYIYNIMVENLGVENVYIVTSNKNDNSLFEKTDIIVEKYIQKLVKYKNDKKLFKEGMLKKEPNFTKIIPKIPKFKSPFNFNEKKQIITSLYPNIPSNQIIEVVNPYQIVNEPFFLNTLQDDVAVLFLISEKDKNRLSMLEEWDPNNKLYGWKQKQYKGTLPEQKGRSGTKLRELINNIFTSGNFSNPMNYVKTNYNIPLGQPLNKLQEDAFSLMRSTIVSHHKRAKRLKEKLYRK